MTDKENENMAGCTIEYSPGTWQPIETAPKNETVVDLWAVLPEHDPTQGERLANCFWRVFPGDRINEGQWCQQYAEAPGSSFEVDEIPTHWMPRPEPPVSN